MLKEYETETEKEKRQKGKKEIKRWHSSILNSTLPHQTFCSHTVASILGSNEKADMNSKALPFTQHLGNSTHSLVTTSQRT